MIPVYTIDVRFVGNQPFILILTKRCNTCLNDLPFDAFSLDSIQKDGYSGRCKQCRSNRYHALPEEEKERIRKQDRESRIPYLEKRRARDRQRHNTDEHRAKRRERNAIKREARKRNPPMPKPEKVKQLSLFKICPRCNEEKFLDEFPFDKNRLIGHSPICKECVHQWTISEEAKTWEREYRKKKMLTDEEYRTNRHEKNNAWRRAHPEQQQELTMRRNARKKAVTTERVSYKRILERDGYHCYICNKPINPDAQKRSPESLTFDHVIPLQPRLGEPQGTHSEGNIKPAHKVCNARKGNKPLEALTLFDKQGLLH